MSKGIGVLLVSHVPEIAAGLQSLLAQVAKDVSIVSVGGTNENELGTSFEKISKALNSFEEDIVFAFYDLGSARMNLEIAGEESKKSLVIQPVAFLEGAYVAASLLQADVDLSVIDEQLSQLILESK